MRALLHLARPKLLPYVLALVILGFAWAHWDRALHLRGGWDLLWVLLGWTALHAGTLWLNAAVDRDEGEVLFGVSVAPPPYTAAVGYAALVGSVPLAAIGDPVAGAACATCVALAILYSHPRILLKGHPLGGPLVNIVGYGLLSPLAGWATVDVSPNLRTALVWGLGGAGIFGTYLAAQAFQGEEDRARGYRTLVATAGPQAVLRLARAAIALAMIGGLTLAVVGWLPRTCLFGVIGWWYVDRHLSVWAERKGGGSERDARIFALRMSGTLVLGILLAFVEYAADSFAHRPVAGLGTEAGHPPDRVRYSQ